MGTTGRETSLSPGTIIGLKFSTAEKFFYYQFMVTVVYVTDRLFLQSSKDPIFVVVKEICWSPITTSSSYREREREKKRRERGERREVGGGGRERGGGRRERGGERREAGGGRGKQEERMKEGEGGGREGEGGREREEEGERFLSNLTCYHVYILFTLHDMLRNPSIILHALIME